MTAKEKIIRESWIAEIGEEKYNEVKRHIEQDGYITLDEIEKNEKIGAIMLEYELGEYHSERGWRVAPKGMDVINTNAGWNRIDEVGLPSESGVYIVIALNLQYECVYDVITDRFLHSETLRPIIKATHYRKKEQLPNPIY